MLVGLAKEAECSAREVCAEIDSLAAANQLKVLQAFWREGVTEAHLWGSTGYGYNDIGREALDRIYAAVFGGEEAFVRSHFVSGTHAIADALLGTLKPGNRLLFASGQPYDTLHKVVGWKGNSPHSLLAKGIRVDILPLTRNEGIDLERLAESLSERVTMVYIQRSRGYDWRRAISCSEIGEVCSLVKELSPETIVFVDNCYGEFVEQQEPLDVGADLVAGSLIKNPGGGLALWGGYIAGKSKLVNAIADYSTAPGLGRELGGTLNVLRSYFQGLFLAPHLVGQALKGAVFAANLFSMLGLETSPQPDARRSDIIQAVRFQTREQLIEFCRGIQQASPIDSQALPEPGSLPGYEHPVIMAAGTFVQGASLELTADAPVREPYIAYLQGGLTYEHAQIGILLACDRLIKRGLVKLGATSA